MCKKLSLIFLCVITFIFQENSIASDRDSHSLFFSLEKDNKISYLLGTQHATPLEKLPQNVLTIINSCNSLSVEHTFSSTNLIINLINQEDTRIFLDNNTKKFLFDRMAKLDQLETYETFIRAPFHGTQLENNEKLLGVKPGVAVVINLFKQRPEGMDFQLIKNFQEKAIESLETEDNLLSTILALIDDMTNPALLKIAEGDLPQFIKFVNSFSENALRDAQSYLADGVKYLQNIKKQPDPRDKIMTGNIIKQHANGKIFAIGARHLKGSEGVLQLLMKAGFTIKIISNDGTFTEFDINM